MSESQQIREQLNRKFIESGEQNRLINYLNTLLNKSGWDSNLDEFCREMIRNRDLEDTSAEDLSKEISTYGRATVDPAVILEVLKEIDRFLEEN